MSVGDANEGLALNAITPSEEIDNAAASAPVSVSVGISPSASVTSTVSTEVCPLETSVFAAKSAITGALSIIFVTLMVCFVWLINYHPKQLLLLYKLFLFHGQELL